LDIVPSHALSYQFVVVNRGDEYNVEEIREIGCRVRYITSVFILSLTWKQLAIQRLPRELRGSKMAEA
jgi:hypothetical protein